jgi:hypothetical protein
VAPIPITIHPRAFAVTGRKSFSGVLASFTDGDPRNDPSFFTATIDWGDGSPTSTGKITGRNPFSIFASHVFPAFQDTHLVTSTVTDENGRTATAVDRVVDPPDASDGSTMPAAANPLALEPGLLRPSGAGSVFGVVASFTDSDPAGSTGGYRATIDWGDGRRSAGMILGANGRFAVAARHRYRRPGCRHAVVVTVTDGRGDVVSLVESVSGRKVGRPDGSPRVGVGAESHNRSR